MLFGDRQTFALKCVETHSADHGVFLGVSLLVASQEIGDSSEISPAGVIVHSANVFLKYSGARDLAPCDSRTAFEHLHETMYGDNWRGGVAAQYRARYAVHEVFDASVSDQRWLVFLVDFDYESRVLLGRRDAGYVNSQLVPRGYVEQVLGELLNWLRRS